MVSAPSRIALQYDPTTSALERSQSGLVDSARASVECEAVVLRPLILLASLFACLLAASWS
jgi:hypothetical protein